MHVRVHMHMHHVHMHMHIRTYAHAHAQVGGTCTSRKPPASVPSGILTSKDFAVPGSWKRMRVPAVASAGTLSRTLETPVFFSAF